MCVMFTVSLETDTQGLSIAAPPYCDLPPRITRRTVAIWSPDSSPVSTTEAACPKDYPFAMYNGAWCCHIDGKVDYKEFHNSRYHYCDQSSCCQRDDRSLIRCPYGHCKNSPDHWELPNNYNSYYGDTKNVGTASVGGQYNNVHDINQIKAGDYVVVQCDNNEYKAFVCDEPLTTWYKDCKDPTDELKVDEMIYFVPHNLHLENARLNCRYSKGNLATIRSHLDNTLAAKVMLMRGLGDKCAFIGFTDEKSSGIWRWMNGRPVTYTNWAYHRTDKGWDQPNDGFGYGKEDYTAMCRWSNTLYNPRNEFKWFDVGPPRNYFGTTVNFELAYSFCSASANFVASTKNCKRPLRPCGGYYINEKKVIEHGKSTFVYCNRGYWLQGNEEVTCNNGVTSPVPKCIRIYYERDGNAVEDQSVESSSVPRVQLPADAEPGDMRDNCVRAEDAARTGSEYIIVESEKEAESGEDSIPRTG